MTDCKQKQCQANRTKEKKNKRKQKSGYIKDELGIFFKTKIFLHYELYP